MAFIERPLTLDDCGEAARLLAEIEQLEDTGEVMSEDDLRAIMPIPFIDIGHNSRGFFEGERLAAIGLLLPNMLTAADPEAAAQAVKLDWTGKVGPDRRGQGLGANLLDWAMSRAPELAGSPSFRVRTRIRKADEDAKTLLANRGFAPIRWYFGMEKPLTRAEDRAVIGEHAQRELRLAPFTPELSAATLETHNAAFADSWEAPQSTPEVWEELILGNPQFRTDLSFVYLDEDDTVAGLILGYHNAAKAEQTGRKEVLFAPIATRREWRGQGVASALMQACGNRALELGFGAAVLEVDSENPTGAFGVYRKAGFKITREFVSYEYASA